MALGLDVVPRLNDQFDPADADLTAEDYFVLTRVDGHTPVRTLCLISGFPQARALAILEKLRQSGAILLPGDVPPPRRRRPPTTAPPPPVDQAGPAPLPEERGAASGHAPAARPAAREDRGMAVPPGRKTGASVDSAQMAAAMAEEVELSLEQRESILAKWATLERVTLFELLEIAPTNDKRAIKRAYFKVSKEFHPDRYYGKRLGSFKEKLDAIFERCTQAFEVLEDDARRAEYLRGLGGGGRTQTPAEHAAELFEAACQHQVTGDLDRALKEFAAAIRIDPQGKYLRRAADAALSAQRLRVAEEYAKKAAETDPRNAASHRTLAKVLRALGRLSEARRALEIASRLDPENEHIAAELEELKGLVGGSGTGTD